jgi:hypothetical protein
VTPEELARQKIDPQLVQCGWVVQNRDEMNISASSHRSDRLFRANANSVTPMPTFAENKREV